MKALPLLLGAVLLAALPLAAAPVHWPVSAGGNGHWYEPVAVPGTNITWTAARDAAAAKGGYLATITSAAENDFVFGVTNTDAYWNPRPGWSLNYGPWLGGYQKDKLAEPAGDWVWVTGEPWNYTNWGAGQPSNESGIEDYVQFFSLTSSRAPTWNDQFLQSYWPVTSYVVEYNSIPEPPTLALLVAGAFCTSVWFCRSRARRTRIATNQWHATRQERLEP